MESQGIILVKGPVSPLARITTADTCKYYVAVSLEGPLWDPVDNIPDRSDQIFARKINCCQAKACKYLSQRRKWNLARERGHEVMFFRNDYYQECDQRKLT